MKNKKFLILMILAIFCMGLTIADVSATDGSDSSDNMTVSDTNPEVDLTISESCSQNNLSVSEMDSEEKLSSVAFRDDEASAWGDSIQLEYSDIITEKILPEKDIQELRMAKSKNIYLAKEYTYTTPNSYKLVKVKSVTYKTVYVDKNGLKDLKKSKSTDRVYKKIPKSIFKLKYDKKLGKKIYRHDWEIKKIKKVKKTYRWKSTKWMERKVGTKKVWVTKKIKTYESWIDDDGYLYKSKSWNPYRKYGYDIKYLKSVWEYYEDGDICYSYYKVKVKKPIYESYSKQVNHKTKKTFYKVKLKQIKYKKVKVPHKLTVFTRINKQPGLVHDYYFEGQHMVDHMYWK